MLSSHFSFSWWKKFLKIYIKRSEHRLYFSITSYLVLDTASFSSKLADAALRVCNWSLRIYFKTISLDIVSSDLLNFKTYLYYTGTFSFWRNYLNEVFLVKSWINDELFKAFRRVTEWVRLEGATVGYLLQSLWLCRVILEHLAQNCVQKILDCLQWGRHHNLSGKSAPMHGFLYSSFCSWHTWPDLIPNRPWPSFSHFYLP